LGHHRARDGGRWVMVRVLDSKAVLRRAMDRASFKMGFHSGARKSAWPRRKGLPPVFDPVITKVTFGQSVWVVVGHKVRPPGSRPLQHRFPQRRVGPHCGDCRNRAPPGALLVFIASVFVEDHCLGWSRGGGSLDGGGGAGVGDVRAARGARAGPTWEARG